MKKTFAAITAAAVVLLAPGAPVSASTSASGEAGLDRAAVVEAGERIQKFRKAQGRFPSNVRGNRLIGTGGSPLYERDRANGFCIIGKNRWFFESRRGIFRSTYQRVLASEGSCGNVLRRGELAIGRSNATEDATRLGVVLEAYFAEESAYPETLTTQQARDLGATITRNNEVVGYAVSAGQAPDDVPAFRFCIVDPEGPWATYDSASGGVAGFGKRHQTCRY